MRTLIICGCLTFGSLALEAGTYELTSVPTGNRAWDVQAWTLLSGTGGSYPEEDDIILNIENMIEGTPTAANISLNGHRTVTALGKTTAGSIRFYNTNHQNNLLKVKETFSVTTGAYIFRSADNGRLSVETKNLVLGQETTAEADTAQITLAGGADYRNIDFTVTGTTTFQGRAGRFVVSSGATAADTHIHLGKVVFDLPALSDNPITGISVSSSAVVEATGLQTTAGSTRGDIRGGGTLRLDGEEGAYQYQARLMGNIHLEKTGASLQVLSRASGNDYTGGTSITGGVLAVRNTSHSGLGSGAVEVSGTGILAGEGLLVLEAGHAVTVGNGGVIGPGEDDRWLNPETPTFQTLTIDGANQAANDTPLLDMQAGSGFLFRLDATGASDRINFTGYKAGGLLLDAGGIQVNITGELSEGITYTLMNFSTDSGLETGLVMGSGFGNYAATFHYDDLDFGGPGTITMTVAAVPEPQTVGLTLLVAAGGYLIARRRNKSSLKPTPSPHEQQT